MKKYKKGNKHKKEIHSFWASVIYGLVRNNFQRANYVNLHDGSKTLKFEDIARLKVMLHVTIRNNDL